MNIETNPTDGRIYGRVERESDATVLFISEQDRRIRFRYTGKSLEYPGAAQYQCTQCPVTALMVHAQFRIADPCDGHDCSLGAGQPQWTPAMDATTTEASAQQPPATTALASRSSHPMKKSKLFTDGRINAQQPPASTPQASQSSNPAKNSPKVVAKAVYDGNGYIQWRSERYPGSSFTFRPNKKGPGRPRYFYCTGCARTCDRFTNCLEACGISRQCLKVSGNKIVDRHPDEVGTNKGHLCQQPLLEEKLKAKMLEKAQRGKQYEKSPSKIKVTGEPSPMFDSTRGHSLDKRPSADPYKDNFGKVVDVPAISLTEAEHREWSKASDISTGLLRGKKLVAYQSQRHQRMFKFVRAGSGASPLKKDAFDYYCLGCWIDHKRQNVPASIHTQNDGGSRADITRPHADSDRSSTDQRIGTEEELQGPENSAIDPATTDSCL